MVKILGGVTDDTDTMNDQIEFVADLLSPRALIVVELSFERMMLIARYDPVGICCRSTRWGLYTGQVSQAIALSKVLRPLFPTPHPLPSRENSVFLNQRLHPCVKYYVEKGDESQAIRELRTCLRELSVCLVITVLEFSCRVCPLPPEKKKVEMIIDDSMSA